MCPARVGDVVGVVWMGGKYAIILSLVHINIYSSYIKCLNCGICLFICRFCKILFTLVLSSGLLDAAAGTFFKISSKQNRRTISHQAGSKTVSRLRGVSDVVLMANPPRGESEKYEFCEIYIECWPLLSLIPSCGDTPVNWDHAG